MRTCAYRMEGGQIFGHNMHTRTKWMTLNNSSERRYQERQFWSYSVLFPFMLERFFPGNIEQCSFLGLPCVSGDSTIPF